MVALFHLITAIIIRSFEKGFLFFSNFSQSDIRHSIINKDHFIECWTEHDILLLYVEMY
jgi:hypothetical protein